MLLYAENTAHLENPSLLNAPMHCQICIVLWKFLNVQAILYIPNFQVLYCSKKWHTYTLNPKWVNMAFCFKLPNCNFLLKVAFFLMRFLLLKSFTSENHIFRKVHILLNPRRVCLSTSINKITQLL